MRRNLENDLQATPRLLRPLTLPLYHLQDCKLLNGLPTCIHLQVTQVEPTSALTRRQNIASVDQSSAVLTPTSFENHLLCRSSFQHGVFR